MDSKAFLAIVLSVLLWLVWYRFFAPTQTPTPQQKQGGPTTATQPKAPPPASVTPTPPVKLDLSTQKAWSIQDSVYRMKIISQGARESSFELLKFKEELRPDSPPMEMIRDATYLPLVIDLVSHKDWGLSRQPFSSDAPTELKVSPGEPPRNIAFQTEIPGKVRVMKIFTVQSNSYAMDMEIQIQNLSAEKLSDNMDTYFYYSPYSEAEHERYNPSRLTFSISGSNHDLQVKDLEKHTAPPAPPYDWVGYQNNYFIQAIIDLDSGYQVFPSLVAGNNDKVPITQLVYRTEAFQIDPGASRSFKFRLYSGPKEEATLRQAGRNLTAAVDYGWFTVIAKPLLMVLRWFYSFTHNYGIAIILLTIIIKVVFWPLTQKSYTSMQKMKKIQPKIQQIREKYKDDREKLNQELMQIYKTYKVNPMGGCLPMALQIPVFFALYRMLNSAVELRHQPFALWIHDLTAPDRLKLGFSIDFSSVPLLGSMIGNLDGVPVLTILMGLTMFIQQKMTPTTGDPRQEKIMLIMPIMFTFFFINFPAGLVLYWFVNNILSIAQQYWINRHAGA
ncbi:MAG TPA: membrane protein insertase YidC [Syntrophobacteraceae bacterium]|nr:membrane protein insertase YidC [Syntrophobacteraceae bacterium]